MDLPTAAPRDLYAHAEMSRLISPSSIAVIGASERPGSLGFRCLANLAEFGGEVFPINAKYRELAGRQCFASLDDVPATPDCAVLAVPQALVEDVARECARHGIGGLVIFASGYAEVQSAHGREAQRRLSDLARETGIRIVGPNTTGFANHILRAHAGFAEFPAPSKLDASTIGLVTQSGSMGLGLSQAVNHGVSISHVLTAGNSCDVDVADHVAFLAEDDHCHAIALAFEGLAQPERLFHAAALAKAKGKSIIAYKLGASEAGSAAALFHTASDAGSDADYDRLFRTAGIVRVPRSEMLLETTCFFAKAPVRNSDGLGVAILSNSGGTAIMAADMASTHHVTLPQPEGETLAAIRRALPPFGAARNPCDATAQGVSNPASVLQCAEAFLSAPQYGALVVPWGKAGASPIWDELARLAESYAKPVCVVWMSQWLEGPGVEALEADHRLCLFRSMESCFHALSRYLC